MVGGHAPPVAGAALSPFPARDDAALARQFGMAQGAGATPRTGPLVALAGIGAAHRERIAQAFALDAPRRLAQARSAIAVGDAAAAADALHALKGSAGTLRCARVHQLAGAPEALASAGLLVQAHVGFGQLERALGDVLAHTASRAAIL